MVLVLVLVNGLLAGAEIAIVSVRPTRLRELASAGSASARAAVRLREDPESFLATVQVGITVVGATAGAFGGAAWAAELAPLLREVPGLAPYAPEAAFLLVVVFITYLSVVLGELVPKSLALRSSERYALLAARPLLAASRLARPVVWLLAASSNAVLRLFGRHTSFTQSRLSAEEIRHLVEDASRTGDVHAVVADIASRALGFAALDAEDVMVHRRFVAALRADLPAEEARRQLAEVGRGPVPVVDPATDEAVGYVTLRDLVRSAPEGGGGNVRVGEIARPAFYVPESMPAVELLRELQRRRTRLAVVVEDHGAMVGVVTLHDLLEELVGELLGEHEVASQGRVRRQPDGTALVDGVVPVHDLNRALGVRLPEDTLATTLGGLCSLLAGGRIPAAGEAVAAPDGTVLEAVEVSPRRVRLLRVRPAGSETA